jgi:trimethylamine--corrinoid protein Co-methyltransferase
MCQRVLRGIEVNDDKLAKELIIEKGPGEDFLVEEHTVQHMRDEFFFPKLANREKREALEPNADALSRAKAFVREICENGQNSRLAPALREQILNAFPEIKMS